MEELYKIAGLKRQVYFAHAKRQEERTFIETRTIEMVKQVRLRHPSMGARPLYDLLRIDTMGINRFERLISQSGLGITRKKSWIKTTDSNHPYRKYNNLTNGLVLGDINRLWASDITYWIESDRVNYLMFMMDVYSRKVIGYLASDNMYAASALKALRMAFQVRNQKYFKGLIHHSDKGSQYCANDYTRALKNAKIAISMANNSLENPYAERLNGIIKNDYLLHCNTSSLAKLKKSLSEVVWLYNNERPHSELNNMTPVEYERMIVKQKESERIKMELYDFCKIK